MFWTVNCNQGWGRLRWSSLSGKSITEWTQDCGICEVGLHIRIDLESRRLSRKNSKMFIIIKMIILYTICLFNIAMENPFNKWSFLAGNIIYSYGPSIPWLC